ncbi:MAG: hypothetical protein Tsb0020_26250 [Haliangiales bacterium]
MAGVSVAVAFVFRGLSVPFIVLALGLIAAVVIVIVRRGDATTRVVLAGLILMVFPWAAGTALSMNLDAPALVTLLARITLGTQVFIGPLVMLLFLTIGGLLDRHRLLATLSFIIAGGVALLSWSTDWIIIGAWRTPAGFLFPLAGALFPLHSLMFVLPIVAGITLSLRHVSEFHNRLYRRYLLSLFAVTILSMSDVLLYYRVGYYPLSVVPVSAATAYTIWNLLARDFLHSRGRGFDRRALWELAIYVAMLPLAAVVTWLADASGPERGALIAMLLLVPLFTATQWAILLVSSYVTVEANAVLDDEAEQALEEFAEYINEPDNEFEIGEILNELLGRYSRLCDIDLYLSEPNRTWRRATPSAPLTVAAPAMVEAWLLEQRRPLQAREFPSWRPGKLREPVAELFSILQADLIVPLIERDALVGVISACLGGDARTLLETEVEFLRAASRLAARAITYIALFREAVQRIEMAREIEVAASVQKARNLGDQRYLYGRCDIVGYSHATRQFGSNWWISHELADQRVVVVLGNVGGQGVPAALISSTLMGACHTALQMRDVDLTPAALLRLLNDTLLAIRSKHHYEMSCFAAIFGADRVQFSNAGFPFPYLYRRPKPSTLDDIEFIIDGDTSPSDDDGLQALVARGTRLGQPDPVLQDVELATEPDDLVLFYSESVVAASQLSGERYGDARLRSFLARHAEDAGDKLCKNLVTDALAHCGDHPNHDDLTAIAVKLCGSARRRRR